MAKMALVKHIILALCFCLLGSAARAQQTPAPQEQQEQRTDFAANDRARAAAQQTLAHVSFFAIGGVGFAGSRSEGEEALRSLLKEKRAVPVLRELLQTATPEGKLYALLGLAVAAPQEFARQVPAYLSSATPVHVMRGCLASQDTTANIVKPLTWGGYQNILAAAAKQPSPGGRE